MGFKAFFCASWTFLEVKLFLSHWVEKALFGFELSNKMTF